MTVRLEVTLETGHLILRPFEAADAEAVQGYVSLWEVARMTSRIPHPYPEGAAAAWIAAQQTQRDSGQEYTFCLALKEATEQPIGAGGLRYLEKGNWEIGYWLAPDYWGRGLGTEAARALVVFGFEKLEAEALQSGHFADNPASGRVLEKAGFAANGIARQWSEARQDFVDANRFLLTRETWEKARAQAAAQEIAS
ncbi:GNAT family N-acetyltransferase [Pelagibius marinus]|uniref:GNAT family N-acetyltransferase n=1 Tax=Pelagibius marinus TaxID=2762760 RepID=UPI001872DED6|nr:GNAT family N-acetyltransferase [Pelagibius marinus]